MRCEMWRAELCIFRSSRMRLCFLKHAKSKYVRGLKIAIKYLQLEQCADSGKVCANEGLEFSGKFITNDRHCSQSRRGLFTTVHSVNEDRQQPIDGGRIPSRRFSP